MISGSIHHVYQRPPVLRVKIKGVPRTILRQLEQIISDALVNDPQFQSEVVRVKREISELVSRGIVAGRSSVKQD